MVVLDLCGGSGAWSKPYRDAGYDVRVVDVLEQQDVRLAEFPGPVHGILAAPPCTVFAGSGSRWWKDRTGDDLQKGLSVIDACLRFVAMCQPEWWALENPVGRLKNWLGKPRMYFNPCDYGDPYTKKTCLWGQFNEPIKQPVEPTEGSKIHLMPPSEDRARLRSVTPPGFAKAFFEANP